MVELWEYSKNLNNFLADDLCSYVLIDDSVNHSWIDIHGDRAKRDARLTNQYFKIFQSMRRNGNEHFHDDFLKSLKKTDMPGGDILNVEEIGCKKYEVYDVEGGED